MSAERQRIADGLHSACVHLVRCVAAVDGGMGLSPARASALSVLVFGGPTSVGKLAAAEGVQSPTMSSLVNGLVDDGLARRRASEHDARAVIVEPTRKGRQLLMRGRQRRVARLSELLAELDDEEFECLRRAAAIIETSCRGAPQRSGAGSRVGDRRRLEGGRARV